MSIKISPSVLSCDFSRLGSEVESLALAGADYIHIDVMDGAFVPSITLGSGIIKAIRKYTDLPFDVHLMVKNPEQHIEQFALAGADIITVHAEAITHLDRVIDQIRSYGKKAGVALVPAGDESALNYIYDKIDLILVMCVNPGFGGQNFILSQLKKIKAIKEKIIASGRNIDLEVDGGINLDTAKQCIENGANVIVAGTYIFRNNKYVENIQALRNCSSFI